MVKSLAVALFALAMTATGAAADPDRLSSPRSLPRVRPHDARSAALLLRGLERSGTIRGIVDRLERSDVIVYVEMQRSLNRQLAGRMIWLTAAGGYRYVRVSLNPDLPVEVQVSVIGHELRHALEVAMNPDIVSEATLEDYYSKIGINMRSHERGWDTQAARDAGDLVRKELAGGPALRIVDSIQAFDPATWNVVYRQARDRFSNR